MHMHTLSHTWFEWLRQRNAVTKWINERFMFIEYSWLTSTKMNSFAITLFWASSFSQCIGNGNSVPSSASISFTSRLYFSSGFVALSSFFIFSIACRLNRHKTSKLQQPFRLFGGKHVYCLVLCTNAFPLFFHSHESCLFFYSIFK